MTLAGGCSMRSRCPLATRHHRGLVGTVPRRQRRRRRASRGGACEGALARTVLLASASAVLRQISARAARARPCGGLAHQSVGRWGDRRHDGASRSAARVIRGSSSHTGARALRDYYLALVQENISPIITPDGPRGPRFKFKPGAILLAQMSGRPMLPHGLCRLARLAHQMGQVRDSSAFRAHRHRHRAAALCAARARRRSSSGCSARWRRSSAAYRAARRRLSGAGAARDYVCQVRSPIEQCLACVPQRVCENRRNLIRTRAR